MKTLTTLMVYSLMLMAFTNCNNDDDQPQNPIDQLPPATQTGENTFGCLVNGELLKVTNSSSLVAIYQGGLLQFGAEYEVENIDWGVTIWLEKEIELKTYILNENFLNIGFFRKTNSECQQYETFSPNSGSVTIKNFDEENFIVSGLFEFEAKSPLCEEVVKITEGRFDLKYIP